jgi:hypothetical protein
MKGSAIGSSFSMELRAVSLDVLGGSPQPGWVVEEPAKAVVAVGAECRAYRAGLVVMVDMKATLKAVVLIVRMSAADSASLSAERHVLLKRDAVVKSDDRGAVVVRLTPARTPLAVAATLYDADSTRDPAALV